MSSTSLRTLLVALILLAGIGFLRVRRAMPSFFSEQNLGIAYIADLDFWHRTSREQQIYAQFPLDLSHDLTEIPLEFGVWRGEDVPQTNVEVFILLEPEQYVQRLYRNENGDYLWLSLIGGRTSRTFHPPDICYDADGWNTNLTSQTLALPSGGELHGMWLDAEKDDTGHRVFYLYLFPNPERNPNEGIVLLKMTGGGEGSVADTQRLMEDFLGHLLSAPSSIATLSGFQ